MKIHHPSCPARQTGRGECVCPEVCGDCGAGDGWHALACPFWDDHCRRCAGELVDVTVHRCEPAARLEGPLEVAPCTEAPELFDRTDYGGHMEAREYCGGCAARLACLSLAGPASSGTFGGRLFVNGRQVGAA